jgi:protease-4
MTSKTFFEWITTLFRRKPRGDELGADAQIDAVAVNAQATRMLVREVLQNHRAERRWRLVRRSLYALSIVVGIAVSLRFSFPQAFDMPGGGDKVAIIAIKGNILAGAPASADQVIPALRKAFERPDVKGIILRINSGGGAPFEAERINAAMAELKAKNPKPVTAVIETLGASAAFMIALQADEVVAGRYSLVGSIGAVLMNWDLSKVIERYDVHRRVYASGELKVALDPFLRNTPKADLWAQGMVNQVGGMFTEELMARRGDKLKQGVKFDTGEVWTGIQAKEVGLIDTIGTEENAIAKMGAGKTLEPEYFGPEKRQVGLFAGFTELITSSIRAALNDLGSEHATLQ